MMSLRPCKSHLFNAKFLADTLCGEKLRRGVCFTMARTEEAKQKVKWIWYR